MVFFDHHTLSGDFRVHRAGSQLKMFNTTFNNKILFCVFNNSGCLKLSHNDCQPLISNEFHCIVSSLFSKAKRMDIQVVSAVPYIPSLCSTVTCICSLSWMETFSSWSKTCNWLFSGPEHYIVDVLYLAAGLSSTGLVTPDGIRTGVIWREQVVFTL